jgi:hypothetical protein
MKNSVEAQVGQTHSRAVIWIDHLTAKVFSMGTTGVTPSVAHAHLPSQHLHHKANTIGPGRVEEDPSFLEQVVKAVAPCREVLIVGPGTEKTAPCIICNLSIRRWCFGWQPVTIRPIRRSSPLGRKHFQIN